MARKRIMTPEERKANAAESKRKWRENHTEEYRAYQKKYLENEENRKRHNERSLEWARKHRKETRKLNLDKTIEEQESIMAELHSGKDTDPDKILRYYTARTMKVWLLSKYAMQEGEEFSGEWIMRDGTEVCSVCWVPRKHSELNGYCVSCGAKMEG